MKVNQFPRIRDSWTILHDKSSAYAIFLVGRKGIYSAPYGCEFRKYTDREHRIFSPEGWTWVYAGDNVYEIWRDY